MQEFVYASAESEDNLNDPLLSPVVTVDEAHLAELYYSTDPQGAKGLLEVYPATETGHVKYDRIMYKLPFAAEPIEGSTKVWISTFLVLNNISDMSFNCYLTLLQFVLVTLCILMRINTRLSITTMHYISW